MLRQQSIRTSSSHTCGLPDPGSFAIVVASVLSSLFFCSFKPLIVFLNSHRSKMQFRV